MLPYDEYEKSRTLRGGRDKYRDRDMAFKIGHTPAILQCAGLACEALVQVLASDPRVLRTYAVWRGSPPRQRDVGAIDRLVSEELRLPYPWLPELLLKAFAARALEQLTGDRRELRVTPAELPPGRGAKDKGRYIQRDVEWYYQAEIKQPPVSKRQLAAQYQKMWTGTTVDPRRTIQSGIARAKELLSIFESFED